MRINVYSQELTSEVVRLEKVSNTGLTYSAAQLILHSSERLHHPPQDDDRSAVTFWLPKSAARREEMAGAFEEIAEVFRTSPTETGLDPDRIPTLHSVVLDETVAKHVTATAIPAGMRRVNVTQCDKPRPEGWQRCTRTVGHLGPCAISPDTQNFVHQHDLDTGQPKPFNVYKFNETLGAPTLSPEREAAHLIRCAIVLVSRDDLSEVAGQSRAAVAHQLQVMLATEQFDEPTLIDSQLTDMLEGIGASDDHKDCRAFFTRGGVSAESTERLMKAIVSAEVNAEKPINMILHCPACGLQHVDMPEHQDPNERDFGMTAVESHVWTNPPHRSHLCAGCGHIWRPADVPTNGVTSIKTRGKADSPREWPAIVKGQVAIKAARWDKIMELCGAWQDSSDMTVKLTQDDATRECLIFVGEDIYAGSSFENALDEINGPVGNGGSQQDIEDGM